LRFIEANTMSAIAAARITAAFSDTINPTIRGYVIDRVASNDKDVYTRTARAVMKFSVADRIGELRAPALVIIGEDDRVTPPVLSEALASRIAGARVARIPESGHISALEQPAAFNHALLEFLDSI
jgi:3-oxoadipate enol-lactonase